MIWIYLLFIENITSDLKLNWLYFMDKFILNCKVSSLRPICNMRSNSMRGFGGLLTKFYLSKVVQRWTMKHSGNPHDSITADR